MGLEADARASLRLWRAHGTDVAQATKVISFEESKVSASMKSSPRSDAPFNAQFAAEQSSVRTWGEEITVASRKDRPLRSGLSDGAGDRSTRIASKIHEAQQMIPGLSATDSRLRILCSAILRRDEVLLDAVLRTRSR